MKTSGSTRRLAVSAKAILLNETKVFSKLVAKLVSTLIAIRSLLVRFKITSKAPTPESGWLRLQSVRPMSLPLLLLALWRVISVQLTFSIKMGSLKVKMRTSESRSSVKATSIGASWSAKTSEA